VSRVKGQGQTRTTHRVSSLRAFGRPEKIFTAESWNSRSRLRSCVRTHFLHFGGLKMRFLPSRETNDSRVRSFVLTYFLLYGDLKMWVLIQGLSSKVMRKDQIRCHGQTWKVKVIHERHIAWAHFVHFGTLKIHLLPSLETHVQGYVAWCELIFFILAAWKCDFCRVVKRMVQEFVASCEHIFSFMATWKCDSLNSWSCEKTKFAARVKGQGQTRTTHRVSSLRAFGRPKNIFTAESWNSR